MLQTSKPGRELLASPETFATTLLTILIDTYADDLDGGVQELLEWAPETIFRQIEDDFSVQLPEVNLDKIMAAIAVVTTNGFYKSLPQFITVCNVFSGDTVSADVFDPADASEIAWGVTEALLLSPPDKDDPEPFTDEIRGYIGAVVDETGLIKPPDVLRLGLFNDISLNPSYDFSDDPAMFEAMWGSQSTRTDEINNMVRSRLQELVNQLRGLKLRFGDGTRLPETLQFKS